MPTLSLPMVASVLNNQAGCLYLAAYLPQRTMVNEPVGGTNNTVTMTQVLNQIMFDAAGIFLATNPILSVSGPNSFSTTWPLIRGTPDSLLAARNVLFGDYPYVGTYSLYVTCTNQGQTYQSSTINVVLTTLR